MVRHADGELTWERPAKPRLPLSPETIRLAQRYDEIFSNL